MRTGLAVPAFFAGLVVSLATSWVLVARLERLGARIGLSEALLGLVAALAADGPEITSSVTALLHHQQGVSAGVTLGSCLFNLAAMLGLAALLAGRIRLHRRVVAFAGSVAIWLAAAALLTLERVVPPSGGLAIAAVGFGAYLAVLAAGPRRLPLLLGRTVGEWLAEAVSEEEEELYEAIPRASLPAGGGPADAALALGALALVVAASVVMERSATSLGQRLGVPELVVGGLVLACVTSIPNAVASSYLARRGRGSATLSTAMNSNNLNVLAGFLLPAAVLGLGARSSGSVLVAAWCVALTLLCVNLSHRGSGLSRSAGAAILVGYCGFVAAAAVQSWPR